MSAIDFLTEGKPIEAQPYAKTTQAVLPDWYTNYAMDILANQQAVANRPMPLPQGPRIAQFTPDQQAAFSATRGGAFSFRPELDTASTQMQGVANRSGLNVAQPFLTQAAGMSGVNAATPGLQQGADLLSQGTQAFGMEAAQPYMAAAGQTAPGVVQQYMNPYEDAVVRRFGELGTRTLKEQILPGIEGEMIRAGQFGGTRQAELFGRGVREAMESIGAQQAQLMQQGFGQAQTAAQTDLNRFAGLAGTAGNLGNAQQQALLTAGRSMADIGQTLGGLTQTEQKLLADIGQTTGSLYNTDTSNRITSAQQLADMASQRQRQELAGAGALSQMGALQQAQTQRNLDLAEADRREQFAYPQQQLDQMLKTFQGVAGGVPKAELVQGYGAPGQQQEFSPSLLAQLGGSAAGIAAILKAFGVNIGV